MNPTTHYHICSGAVQVAYDNSRFKFFDPQDKQCVYPIDHCPHCNHALFQSDVGSLLTTEEPSEGFSPQLLITETK